MSVETILNQAAELTLEQRAELLRRLEENLLDSGWQPELSDDLNRMLDERIRESDENPGAGVPWEVVLEQARKRWSDRARSASKG